MTHSAPSARSRRQRRAAAAASSAAASASAAQASAPRAHAPRAQAPQDPARAQARSARDQASGRPAAPGSGWWRHIPYALVLCGVALALAWMREDGQNVKGGTLAVAGILFAAALARLALPERRAGMLASRRRLADVAVLAALGTGLLVAGLVLQEH
jgi:Protein of unknown function (DUF3017)